MICQLHWHLILRCCESKFFTTSQPSFPIRINDGWCFSFQETFVAQHLDVQKLAEPSEYVHRLGGAQGGLIQLAVYLSQFTVFFLLIGRFNSSTSGDICHLIQSQASGHLQQSHDPSIPTHFLKVHMVEIEQSLSWCGFWDGGMVTIPPLARITYRLTGEESEYKSQLRLNLKGYPKIKN